MRCEARRAVIGTNLAFWAVIGTSLVFWIEAYAARENASDSARRAKKGSRSCPVKVSPSGGLLLDA